MNISRYKPAHFLLIFLFWVFPCGAFFQDDAAEARHGERGGREIVLHGGKIFTSNPRQLWAEALSIRDGKIRRIGSNTEILARARHGARLIDLEGHLVVPGFNDAHTHAAWSRNTELRANDISFVPGPGPTAAELYADIAAAAQTVPPGTWITGIFGTTFVDDPMANRFDLDQVSQDNPVHLHSWAGHGTLINSAAMVEAGIAENEPDPLGGFYERVEGTDILNGFLHEYAEHQFERYLKSLIPAEEMREQYLAYANAVVTFGTTSIQDMAIGYTKQQSEEILAGIDLPIRWRDICFPLDLGESCDSHLRSRRGDRRLTSTGIKWITDGSPIERFAHTRLEYSDLPGWFGVFNFPDSMFLILSNARRGNPVDNQLLLHAVGDQAVDNVLAALNDFPGGTWKNRRVRIEHGDLIMADHFNALRRQGMIVAQNPLHFTVSDTLLARYGADRFAVIQPLRSLVEEGIHLALGSDQTLGPANPMLDLFFAVIHPSNPAEALTLEQAVIAYTHGSAYAEFQEHIKGTLARGKLADLAVLSQDIFTLPPPSILSTVSILTMVGGEIVHETGVLDL